MLQAVVNMQALLAGQFVRIAHRLPQRIVTPGPVLCLLSLEVSDILLLVKPPGLCRKVCYLSAALSFLAEVADEVRQTSANA